MSRRPGRPCGGGIALTSIAEQDEAELGGRWSVLVRQKRDHQELDRLLDEVVVDGDEQRVEVLEALVEVAGVEAGLLADGADRRARPALGAEELQRCVEEEGAPLGPTVFSGEPDPPGGVARGGGGRGWQRPLP